MRSLSIIRTEGDVQMKEKIHPEYYPEAQVSCACGNSFTVGSTRKVIKVDSCSKCNPFFTGERRILDTAGQVEKFNKRMARAVAKPAKPAAVAAASVPVVKAAKPPKAPRAPKAPQEAKAE